LQPFHDVRAQYLAHRTEIDAAVRRVLESGSYLLGPELARFESAFADWVGARRAVGVGSGTAALELALRAAGVRAGDEVVVPALTAAPTVQAVLGVGAVPCVVDVDDDTLTLDPEASARAITTATRAVVPVHLFGQCAEMAPILAAAEQRGVAVIEDAAQAHGAMDGGRRAGTFGLLAAFSFYPTKNLGAFGDAGAVVTGDPALADRVARLRNYARGGSAYDFEEPAGNERMDDLHAAILGAKLPHVDAWNGRRRERAAAYRSALADTELRLPAERPGAHHVYHQFTVRTPRRDALRRHLAERGVETLVHYPAALHELTVVQGRARVPEPPLRAARAVRELLSLPIYPELPDGHFARTVDALRAFV
jgi:dTDP-3-amino-3,4,6-trideoxy-alpha-D-glucose transaminase